MAALQRSNEDQTNQSDILNSTNQFKSTPVKFCIRFFDEVVSVVSWRHVLYYVKQEDLDSLFIFAERKKVILSG